LELVAVAINTGVLSFRFSIENGWDREISKNLNQKAPDLLGLQ
jgi:hypothetical protein